MRFPQKQECVCFKEVFPTVRWRQTHGAGEEGLWVELGLPSANGALTFVFAAIVAVAVGRAKVSRRPLWGGPGARGALHPRSLPTKTQKNISMENISTIIG